MVTISGYVRTDKGRVRPINEDNFCINRYFKTQEADADAQAFGGKKDTLVGVFDGIGGEENGEVASFIAAKTLARFDSHIPEMNWNIPLNEMNRRINEYAKMNHSGNMGSTAAMLYISKGVAQICNLGDSPIFLYSNGKLRKISKDHNELQRALDMNLKDFNIENTGIKKNRLTKFLGIKSNDLGPHVVVDIELHDGDALLLCSDGLTNMVPLEEIEQMMGGKDCKTIVDSLLEKALENGGKDNVTVMVVCCEDKKASKGNGAVKSESGKVNKKEREIAKVPKAPIIAGICAVVLIVAAVVLYLAISSSSDDDSIVYQESEYDESDDTIYDPDVNDDEWTEYESDVSGNMLKETEYESDVSGNMPGDFF